MGDVVPFRKRRTVTKSLGLCQHGHHRWEVCKESRFDVRKGKLVTVYRCQRCGREKRELR